MAILIFKTNINKRLLKSTAQIFDVKEDIERWTVDLEDRDKVLRIESINNNPHVIVEALAKIGIKCQELI
jgi:hypothetical protein